MSANDIRPIVEAVGLVKQVVSDGRALNIVDHVSLSVFPGESVAIVGVSGSGKSTLLGLLAGLDTPSSGTVRLDGEELTALSEDGRAAVRARALGFVFQTFQLLPALTAIENVMLPLELAGRADAREAARALLERVGLGARITHYPKQLSGGEQQRVAIARAIAKRPQVLLCDEPTGALDYETGKLVLEVIAKVNAELGTTAMVITHNAAIAGMADRVLRLGNGKIVGESRPERKLTAAEISW